MASIANRLTKQMSRLSWAPPFEDVLPCSDHWLTYPSFKTATGIAYLSEMHSFALFQLFCVAVFTKMIRLT